MFNYDYCIRFIEEGKIKTSKGSLTSPVSLDNANDIFKAIELSLPLNRGYESFSICEFKQLPLVSL